MRLPLAIALLLVATAAPASGLTVSLNPGSDTSEVWGYIYDDTAGPVFFPQRAQLGALPASGTAGWLPGFYPPYVATVAYDLDHDGFGFDVVTEREGENESIAGASGSIWFTVSEAVGYALSAAYAVSDPDGYTASFRVALADLTSTSNLYFTDRVEAGTPNPAFDVASPHFSDLGSRTGTLLPGHEYRLQFNYQTYALDALTPSGAPGLGAGPLTLSFVPEPALPLLAGLAAAALTRASCRSARPAPPRGAASPATVHRS